MSRKYLSEEHKMTHKVIAQVLLCCMCCFGPLLGQQITESPGHAAGRYGTASAMRCRADLHGDNLEWTFFPNGTGTGERVYISSKGDVTEEPGDYAVPPSSDRDNGIYDLTILDTQTDMAGIYKCRLFNQDINREANFVAVSPASCYPYPGQLDTVEGATVFFSCEVGYTGYKAPSLRWYSQQGELQGDAFKDWEQSNLEANVTATPALDGVTFSCDVFFETHDGEQMPAPSYNDTCSTYFRVSYGVTDIELSPDFNATLRPGDLVNCSAMGRPDPAYSWYRRTGDVGDEIYLGQSLLVEETWQGHWLTFECVAENLVSGQPREARATIFFFVEGDQVEEVEGGGGGMEGWMIAVAVLVPLIVLGIAIAVAYYVLKRNKKKPRMREPLVDPRVLRHSLTVSESGSRPGSQEIVMTHHSSVDSPGYADLGVRVFGASNGAFATSNRSLAVSNGSLAASNGGLAASRASLAASKGSLAVPKGSIAGSKGSLAGSKGSLAGSKGSLAGSEGPLARLQRALAETKGPIGLSNRSLAASKGSLSGAQMELIDSKAAIGVSDRSLAASKRSLAVSNRSLAMSNKSLAISKGSLGMSNQALNIGGGILTDTSYQRSLAEVAAHMRASKTSLLGATGKDFTQQSSINDSVV